MLNITGKKKIYLTISIILLLISVVSLIVQGFNRDTDFVGGMAVTYTIKSDFEIKDVEDIVSGVAILKTYGEDAKTLAQKAKSGDNEAINAYFHLGKVLGEALLEIAEIKKVNRLVIGGQISKAFDLLYDGILAGLGKVGKNITVVPAKNPANAALIGAAMTLF